MHVDEFERPCQLASQVHVALAGRSGARGMVVRHDHAGRIVHQRLARNLARIHGSARQGAPEQFFAGNHAVARIEEQAQEYFMRQRCQRQAQVVVHRRARVEAGRQPQ
ncbi:hypothetical protein D3C80_1690940 [compost metagenome]